MSKMPNKKDVLIAYNAEVQNIATNSVAELNLTAIESNSDKLTVANNKVIVGKDVDYIDCTFNLSTWGGMIALMYIRKNDINELQHTVSNNSASIRKIIKVQENDEIFFAMYTRRWQLQLRKQQMFNTH